jgi:hypothetical protein
VARQDGGAACSGLKHIVPKKVARASVKMDAMDDAADVVDDLALALFRLRPQGMATQAVTAAITRAIVVWAVGRGWSARTEARVAAAAAGGSDPQLGFIDLVIHRGQGRPALAVEIDSTDKQWSVAKLRHAVAGGMHAIWIRWGDEDWAGIYDDVDVIQLHTLRRRARRRSHSNQLEMWR